MNVSNTEVELPKMSDRAVISKMHSNHFWPFLNLKTAPKIFADPEKTKTWWSLENSILNPKTYNFVEFSLQFSLILFIISFCFLFIFLGFFVFMFAKIKLSLAVLLEDGFFHLTQRKTILSSGGDGASELILLATASIEGENQAQFV